MCKFGEVARQEQFEFYCFFACISILVGVMLLFYSGGVFFAACAATWVDIHDATTGAFATP